MIFIVTSMLGPVNRNRPFPDGVKLGEPNLLVTDPGIFSAMYVHNILIYLYLHQIMF